MTPDAELTADGGLGCALLVKLHHFLVACQSMSTPIMSHLLGTRPWALVWWLALDSIIAGFRRVGHDCSPPGGFAYLPMPGSEYAFKHTAQISHQMPTISYLHRCGCTPSCCLRINTRTITCDDRKTGHRRSHSAKLSAVRSGNRSTAVFRSRSHKIVR
jgi:hypothetical protein